MGSVNISLREDARSERQNVLRFFGVLKDAQWEKKDKVRKELRDEFEKIPGLSVIEY